MDKNKIKNHLISRFISEETTPGISLTTKIQKDNAKINKDGVKDIEKNLTDMEKSLKKDGVDAKNMPANKFNYDDDFEKTYHDEMEIMNGQEMLQYDSEPSAEYKKRVKAGIEGSSTMGNQGGIGNAQAAWGASSDDFGKDLVKRAKSSSEKRNKQTPTLNLRGRDIQADMKDTGHRPYALSENVESTDEKNARIISGWMAETGVDKVAEKLLNRYSETGMLSDMPDSMEYGTAINKIISLLNKKQFTMAMKSAKTSATKLDKKAMKDHGMFENNDNNKPKIKEGMKRLKFKKEFNGVGNALKMIPESYRVDDKQFEMTDGNETYKIRWEGNLTEGRAVVLMASDKRMVNEDMAHMKHLMGYKSNETLGLVKGNARINENAVFGDIYNKSKVLLEGADIESVKAKTGNLEDIKKKAPEATKHVQGSVSKDKGTQAPAAKEGDLDDAVSQAPEAKAHVQGSVSTEKGTKAPAAKNGNWEDVKKKSADATKHVTLKESFNDEEEEEEGGEEGVEKNTEVKTEGSDIEGTKASRTAPWEDHTIGHAPEAKAHVKMGTESKANLETEAKEMNEGITLGGIRFEPINESYMEEEEEEEEEQDGMVKESEKESEKEEEEEEEEEK